MRTRRIWSDIAREKPEVNVEPRRQTFAELVHLPESAYSSTPVCGAAARTDDDKPFELSTYEIATCPDCLRYHAMNMAQIHRDQLAEVRRQHEAATSFTFDENREYTARELSAMLRQVLHSRPKNNLQIDLVAFPEGLRRKYIACALYLRHHFTGHRDRRGRLRPGKYGYDDAQVGDVVRAFTDEGTDIYGVLIGGGQTAKVWRLTNAYYSQRTETCWWPMVEKIDEPRVTVDGGIPNREQVERLRERYRIDNT